jgi:hypothetical protein
LFQARKSGFGLSLQKEDVRIHEDEDYEDSRKKLSCKDKCKEKIKAGGIIKKMIKMFDSLNPVA